jgi:uncharacterized integral membrane protein
MCLLCKWLYKLLLEEEVWQELLTNIYLRGKTLSQVQAKPTDSPFWKGIMGVKDDFFQRGSFVICDGLETYFWEDIWLGDTSLANQYPTLYNIFKTKFFLVAHVLNQTPLNIRFNRTLVGDKWDAWVQLISKLMSVHLSNEPNKFKWNLTITGSFLVKSMYVDIMNGHTVFLKIYFWKIKVPLKIGFLCGFFIKKVILTKDNLAKR